MRIAINARMLQKGRLEGIGRYIYETTKRMILNHPEDTFYLLFDRAYDAKYLFAENVIPIVIGPPTRHPILWKLWFEYRIPYILKRLQIDVFLSGDGYCSLKTDVPTLMVSHDLAFEHFNDHNKASHLKYYRKYSPQFHVKADHLIAVSEATKKDIIQQYGIDAEKISVITNAASDSFKPNDNIDQQKIKEKYTEGKDYFIYLGSLHPRKNILRLIHGFEQFKATTQSAEKLVLVGRLAWKADEIKASIQSSVYHKDIIHLSQIESDVGPLVSSAKAMIYVSLFEGFGLPILEAMQSGIPVICSNISSMPEVGGKAALLVNPNDINDIASAIALLSKNSAKREAMVEQGFLQAAKFSWSASAAKTYDCIKWLASN